MPSDQPLIPGIAPPRPRQVGRRCPPKHRRCWPLTGGWLWCPDCGALCPKDVPSRRRWAYPGDKADAVDQVWAEQRKARVAEVRVEQVLDIPPSAGG